MKPFLIWMLCILSSAAYAQKIGVVYGTVRDKNTQELLTGATVVIESTPLGTAADIDGNFKIEQIPVGSYNVSASYIGYKKNTKTNIVVTSGNDNSLTFELDPTGSELAEVVISVNKSVNIRTAESPNSIQRLSAEEIKSNPGGNNDISRVVQVLPGVASVSGGGGPRNDLIIRGGAPNENVYFLDGVEVPIINHFTTQGSAGGSNGIINVSFIEDVNLSSSSFNAKYDNALSSVMQIKQRTGNPDRLSGNFRLSGTDAAATLEGPLGSKNTTFLASVRRSYLQFLFQALDLPIRPSYWDFQYKVTHKLDAKTTITAIGLGAIDEFTLAVPKVTTPNKEYIVRSQPFISQWNYTTGVAIKRLVKNGFFNIALSRNMLNNGLDKFEDRRDNDETARTLKVRSREIENKLRVDYNKVIEDWKVNFGGVTQYVKFQNDFYSRILKEVRDPKGNIVVPAVSVKTDAAIDFFKYGIYGQANKRFLDDKLSVSLGLRTDMNSFLNDGNNPLATLSPRASASYSINDQWTANASIGRYYKMPIYTVLGFKDAQGNYANKNNKYIGVNHYVTGLEFLPGKTTRITVEGFYKQYDNYPVSARTGISLANLGGTFGAIGNEATTSIGKGRSYGGEFFFQQTLTNNLFAVLSYTLYWSEFSGKDGKFIPSAWDGRHILSTQIGRKFKRNWEMGLKYRYQGGVPYTPYDIAASKRNFATLGVGVVDYTKINSERLNFTHQFDFRMDKKFNFRRATLDIFFDVTNALLFKNIGESTFILDRNKENTGFVTTDNKTLNPDGSNGVATLLPGSATIPVPTLGFIFEF
jgi:outer membrane receptor for ferrienterochelin and colicin